MNKLLLVCPVYIFLQYFLYNYANAQVLNKPAPNKIIQSKIVHETDKHKQDKFTVYSHYILNGKSYNLKTDFKYAATGIASWYGGAKFYGKKTANGTIYNDQGFTAAHKTLPLPSVVKVTNLNNKKSLILVVNDRGPFNHKLIDVSKKAAHVLGFLHQGNTMVRIEYLHSETESLLKKLSAKDYKKANKLLGMAIENKAKN